MPLLIIEKGKDKGKKVRLDKDETFEAGRGQNTDLRLRDSMTSRNHFKIEYGKSEWYITDCGSSNGTFVNNKRIDSRTRLEMGDVILTGDILLSFSADPDAGETLAAPGTAIAGYIIEKRIGRGGMGTVYKALQVSLDRPVALKVLSKELLQDKNFINMFIREARAAGQLNHPNIVQVYDVGSHDGTYYFSMEYMGGGSIEDSVNRDGKLPLHVALQFAIGSARGLEYAKKRGIVHRDIKPDNLMLTDENTVKIGDLGIARPMQEGRVSQKEGVSGSPHYMAPEQAQGLDIDNRADIYGLGVSVFQMLTGRTPYLGSSPREVILKQINEPAPSIRSINPDVPEDVCAVVERMMAKDRGKRYQEPADLIEDLKALQRKYPGEDVVVEGPGLDLGKLALPGMIVGIAIVVAVIAYFLIASYIGSSRRTDGQRKAFRKEIEKGVTALVVLYEKSRDVKKLRAARKEAERLYDKYHKRDDNKDFADLLKKLWRQHDKIVDKLAKEDQKRIRKEIATRFKDLMKKVPGDISNAGDGELAKAKGDLEVFVAVEAYRKFPQWTEADIKLAEIKQEIVARSQFKGAGRDAVKRLDVNVRKYVLAKKFLDAIKECDSFPKRYKKLATVWAKKDEIEADLMKAIRDEVHRRLAEVQLLVDRDRLEEAYEKARRVERDFADKAFDIFKPRIKDKKDDIEKLIKSRDDRAVKKKFERDRDGFREMYTEALKYLNKHDFKNARNEFTSGRHGLKTKEFRKRADDAAEAMKYLVLLKTKLCKEMNGNGKLNGVVFKPTGQFGGKIIRAGNNYIFLESLTGGEDMVSWSKLASKDIGKLIALVDLSPEETLGRAVYLQEIGEAAEAKKRADEAISRNKLLKKVWQDYVNARDSR